MPSSTLVPLPSSSQATTTGSLHHHQRRTQLRPTTAFEDLIAFANLSTGTLRSMGGNGLLIRIPVTAGVDLYSCCGKVCCDCCNGEGPFGSAVSTTSQAPVSSSSLSSSAAFAARLDLPSHQAFAPRGFFTSRWSVALVLVTARINIIQHICRPPTPSQLIPSSEAYPPQAARAHWKWWHWAQRAWLGDLFVNPTLGQYRIEARSSTHFWTSFLAAAATVVTESLIKSLEGGRDQDLHSFNLTGFAYITHAYVFSPDSEHGYPGTPTWSLFFSTFLQIAELWTLSVASLSRARPRSRLPVTTVFGIASTFIICTGDTSATRQTRFTP
ncbi:hypothetical protein CF319_g5691 [Tilletia indica]|nr:hypothetical protein CF319_g5691 [Tilletia indica]